MDDVARHLSMSKKTLYHYFADKDEIVTMVAAFHMERDKEQFESFHLSAKNAIDELIKISSCLRKDFQKMNPNLLFDMQKYHATAWSAWLMHKKGYIKQSIIRNLNQGIEEGFFRAEINTEVLAIVRLETVQATFEGNVFPSEKYDLGEVNMQLFEHFVQGILTDKGRKVYEKYKLQSNNSELIPQSI